MERPDPQRATDPTSEQSADPATAHFRRYRHGRNRAELECALILCAPALRRAARQFGDAADADDLVQDCFVVAIRRADEFADNGRLLPWLIGILQNCARSRHRWRWRRLRQPPHADGAERHATVDEGAALVDRDDWFRSVAPHLERLAEPYRTVVTQHLVGGVPLVDLAGQLGRPANTVRSQFARGLQDLRRRLPAPMLAGLAAMLGARSANAGSTWVVSRTATGTALVAGVLLTVLLAALFAPEATAELATTTAAAQSPVQASADLPADAPAADPIIRTATAEPAPVLTVRLRHLNGAPAFDLPVIFEPNFVLGMPTHRAYASWRFAKTDENGIARFDLDVRGSAAIRISDASWLHRFDVGDSSCDFTFPIPEDSRTDVRVVDDEGQPIPGATIHASATDGIRSLGWPVATTDDAGRAFVRCAIDRFYMWAVADGHTQSGLERIDTGGPMRGTGEINLRLSRTDRRCRGTVTTEDGRPAAHASVGIWIPERRRPRGSRSPTPRAVSTSAPSTADHGRSRRSLPASPRSSPKGSSRRSNPC